MKKLLAVILTALTMLSLTACGSSPTADDAANTQSETAKNTADYLDNENGKIKFVGIEKATDKLLIDKDKGKNIWILKFEFTNLQSDPRECQSMFKTQIFQNGVELTDSYSSSSNGGTQYILINNFFTDVMDGGTVTFGRMANLEENKEITIVFTDYANSKNSTKFTVPYPAIADAETVRAALLGSWTIHTTQSDGVFTFNADGTAVITSSSSVINGTYEVNTDLTEITLKILATKSNAVVTSHLTYNYENGTLHIYNDNGDEFAKQTPTEQ